MSKKKGTPIPLNTFLHPAAAPVKKASWADDNGGVEDCECLFSAIPEYG